MKIQLYSDLHLEAHPAFAPQPAPGADLLVLAGDIGSYQAGSALAHDPDFGLARFSPRQGWPTPVLFVPGNHEYDALDFDVAHARLRETCERLGIVWLERAVWQPPVPDTQGRPLRFIGTTLWTDFDALVEDLLAAINKSTRYDPENGSAPPYSAALDGSGLFDTLLIVLSGMRGDIVETCAL